MRNTSESVMSDVKLRKRFDLLAEPASFHAHDAEEVYGRYVTRSEGLIARDTRKALMQTLHAKSGKKKGGRFEQLREVKRKRGSVRKLDTGGGELGKEI